MLIASGRVTVNGKVVTELGTKVDPERAGGDLATLTDPKLDKKLRAAAALAWGEVAAVNKDAASGALDKMMHDPDNDVRAAAATAAGMLGNCICT